MEKVSLFLNRLAHTISSVILLALMILTVTDVVGRSFFNKPIRGTFELTEFALVLIVFLALGYAQHNDDHVVIDLLYVKLPEAVQRLVYLLSTVISLMVVSLMAWRLYVYSGRMLAGNYITAVLRVPLQPLVIIAALGTASFALALISTLVKHYAQDRGDKI